MPDNNLEADDGSALCPCRVTKREHNQFSIVSVTLSRFEGYPRSLWNDFWIIFGFNMELEMDLKLITN